MLDGRAIPPIALICAAIALPACKPPPATEPAVIDEDLPRPSSGPLESARDEPVESHIDVKHGFSIAIPAGWSIVSERADGASFANPEQTALLHLLAVADVRGTIFERSRNAFRENKRDLHELESGANDYRGSAIDGDDYRVQLRLLRVSGKTIAAEMRYPASDAGDLDPAAAVALNSLSTNLDNNALVRATSATAPR